MLPYRTILRLPESANAVQIVEHELETWLTARGKVDRSLRNGFLTGQFFEQGHHRLAASTSLAVARSSNPDKPAAAYRFLETSKSGVWQVDFLVAGEGRGARRPDNFLMVTASRVDEPEADMQVDPPGVVRQLLDRQEVFDSKAVVTGRARRTGPLDAEALVEAILDPDRSVSVVVGASLGAQFDERFVEVVDRLTAKLCGVASVAVLHTDALDVFNRLMPDGLGVSAGQVRTYLSEIDLDEPSELRRHRILSPQRLGRALNRQGRLHKDSGLPAAFAAETRGPMLARPLPAALRRARAELTILLDDYARAARLDAALVPSKARVPRPRPTRPARQLATPDAAIASGLLTRVRSFVERWLGVGPVEPDENVFDQIDTMFERTQGEVELLKDRAVRAESSRDDLEEKRGLLEGEVSLRSNEVAEAESELAKLKREVLFLRRTLVQQGSGLAYQVDSDTTWAQPEDLTTLVLQIGVDSTHRAANRVVFTGDLGVIDELERRAGAQLYATRCWEFVHTLFDYAELVTAGSFSGGMRAYLQSTQHEGFKVTPKRHAASESESTMNQYGEQRRFAVPKEVDPSGSTLMPAHFKIDQSDTVAPRLHYFDDVARSGKIYVGYIGPHLSNTKTKNA